MIPYLRRQKILDNLKEDKITYINEIEAILNDISISTIRRDLKLLEKEGKIELLNGGGIKYIKSQEIDVPVNIKKDLNKENKINIAKKAAEIINDGEVIYIDSGTTCSNIFNFLENKKNIVLVTSNTDVVKYYSKLSSTTQIVLLGGIIDMELGSVVGPITESTLSTLYFDKSFVGTTSINNNLGVTTPNMMEAKKKSIVSKNSKQTFVMADSSKFDKFAMCKALSLEECSIITDKYVDLLEKCNEYIVCD